MIRLNVGAGNKYLPGFINIDRHGNQDLNSDAFPLPFTTDYADELWAIHLFEHLPRKDASAALTEWFRVLKPGGKLVVEVPCLDKIARMIVNGEKNLRLTLFGLFGDPRDGKPDMMHQWCWSQDELTEALNSVGFERVAVMDSVFHVPRRDMRAEGFKP